MLGSLFILAIIAPCTALKATVRRVEGREASRALSFVSELCAQAILSAEDPVERSMLSSALQRDLSQRLGRSPSALLLAEDADGAILGCAAIEVGVLSPEALDAQRLGRAGAMEAAMEQRPLLSSLAVSKQARRRGLAQRLCAEAEGLAKEWGYPEVLLKVERNNGKARNLYRKLGYRVVAVDQEAERPVAGPGGVQFVPTVQVAMRKSLSGVPPVDVLVGWALAAAAAAYGSQLEVTQQVAEALSAGRVEEVVLGLELLELVLVGAVR